MSRQRTEINNIAAALQNELGLSLKNNFFYNSFSLGAQIMGGVGGGATTSSNNFGGEAKVPPLNILPPPTF